MGLISGSAACTRFNVIAMQHDELNFDLIPFRPIQPQSNLREQEGFIPFEPDEPFEIGARRWAFRVRIDKVTFDSTLVGEMVKRMVKEETEAVGPPSPKKRRQFRQDAEDALMAHPVPRVKVIECVLEESVLYVGSTSKGHLGTVLELLKRIGVEAEVKTPWLDAGQEEEFSEIIELKEPGQSVHGSRFLKALLNDPDVLVEPEKGSVKLMSKDGAKLSLAGPVLNELDRCLEQEAMPLNAKLLMNEFSFSFDALSYRINGLKLDTFKNKHWTEALDERLDKIKELYAWLDEKYQATMLNHA